MLIHNQQIGRGRFHIGPLVLGQRRVWRSLLIPSSPLTERRMCDWIATAMAGDVIQYHEGFLLQDRSALVSSLPVHERTRVCAVARRAWIACELGLVHLFSQRLGDGHYRYFAVRSQASLAPARLGKALRKAARAANDHRFKEVA